MKKYERKLNRIRKALVLAVIGVVILMAFVSLTSAISPSSSSLSELASIEPAYLNKNGLTTHEPIYINGNGDFVVGQNGVVSGNGTENNPYIIEGWDINASILPYEAMQGYQGGIHIEYTNAYFIIKNCVIHDGRINESSGVHFYNVRNGSVDNVSSYNNYVGIFLAASSWDFSNNNRITNCLVHHNFHGIGFNWASGCRITSCTVYENDYGIGIDESRNSIITTCDIYSNSYGIVVADALNTDIDYCNIYNNKNYGVYSYAGDIISIVNATYNWWGSASGPYHPTTNPDSAGDNVTDNVIYNPWLTEPWSEEEKGLTPHDPISINGNADFASQASSEGWAGDGTKGNPYIIENYEINASGVHGIKIINTNVYFIIRNCLIRATKYPWKFGILFNRVENGIVDNITSYNSRGGIFLDYYSNNNRITNSTLYNNFYGILLYFSSSNQITHNNIANNEGYGVYMVVATGGYLPSAGNFFYHNNFINNTIYDPYTNYWDDGTEGNYWGDYTGVDENSDGIGDTSYNISGGDNKDNYPLIHEIIFSDKEMPVISLLSPDNNSVIKPGTVISFNIADVNLWNASYCVDNSAVQYFSSFYDISTDGWKNGIYNIAVYAKDWGMNENTEMFTFTIDSILPNISLISPDNNSIIQHGTNLDFEINDVHLNLTTYTVNNGLPETLSLPYNISTEDWEDGMYNITVYADDLAGNEITKTFTFTIDSTPPDINITGVVNESYYNTNITPVINITDAHLNEDGTIITLDTAPFISGVTVSSEGEHVLYVYAVDKAGNNATQSIIFIIDKTKSIITLSGVTDGAYYNTDVAPMVDISDANLNITSITLNDNPFTNGTTISIENTYTLFVQANDKAGNTVNKTITFVVDRTAPTITITESSHTTSKKTFTMSWSASENIQYYEVSTDGVNWVNVSASTQYTFTLSKGANTLYVRGTDLAGNTGTNMITVTYKKEEPKGFIPSFELIYLISAICLALAFKRRKRI